MHVGLPRNLSCPPLADLCWARANCHIFVFFKGIWVDQVEVNFHQNGRTNPHGKGEKNLLVLSPGYKIVELELSRLSTVFFWKFLRYDGEITTRKDTQRPGVEPPGPILPPLRPESYKKGAGGKRVLSNMQSCRIQLFSIVLRWREEEGVDGHTQSRAAGNHWEAFVKDLVRPLQLSSGRKLSPPASQNKQAFFLWNIFLVMFSVTQWLGPSLLVSYQLFLFQRKPLLDSSGEPVA